MATIVSGEHFDAIQINIDDGKILDNSTRPSLYNGTIAWDDGTSNGNIFYWNGSTIETVADKSFSGHKLSLYDGTIAYRYNDDSEIGGVHARYWDGTNSHNISGDVRISSVSMHNGNFSFMGSNTPNQPPFNNYVYFNNGTDTTQITTEGWAGHTSVYDGTVAYIHYWPIEPGVSQGGVFLWDGNESTLIDTDHFAKEPSLYEGNIAWTSHDGNDNEIYYWNGLDILQITDNEYEDRLPSLYDGHIAWHAGAVGDEYEIFFWDGNVTHQVTDNDISDSFPSLYNDNIAWMRGNGPSGDAQIMYATNIPEPSSIAYAILISILYTRKKSVIR